MKAVSGLFTFVTAAGAAIFALAVSSCSGDEYTQSEVFVCPNKSLFTGIPKEGGPAAPAVSTYMERRCGTLDCHGAAEIPMRLYGQFGRRYPTEGNIPGGAVTTPAELDANYATVCSVEPEKTASQADNFGPTAEELLIVRKARGIERHKGGKVVNANDAADKCIVGWLRGNKETEVESACKAAIESFD